MAYRTLNPATGELLETYPGATGSEIDRALEAAANAFHAVRRLPVARRAEPMHAVAGILESRAPELARLMALEMGKPLRQGEAEIAKCAAGCRYFADHAAEFLAASARESDGSASGVRYLPLGPVLAIMPWNFPFWQFFRFAAPALMAGNTVVLKHAPCTPRCATEIVSLVEAAGFPKDAVQSLFLSDAQAAEVIADRRIRGVTLTGSTAAGSAVGAVAGRNLKPMVLELGGSDPFIVFDDADLERAIDVGVTARCQNSGQSCIASKRFLIERSCYETFASGFTQKMRGLVVGDPFEPTVEIGPLARGDLRDRLSSQVAASVEAGAEVLCGGRALSGPGFFFPPSVLAKVPSGTPAAEDELFGPVATLIPFSGEEEALRLANGTRYGLGASLWTGDPDRAGRLVDEIEAGAVFVNGLVKSDPRLPFGGIKDSGFGRELSREGILEFVNPKTTWYL